MSSLASEIAVSHDVFLEPLTVQQYHAMMKAGILREGAPIELIDGLLVRKDRRDSSSPRMTVGTFHSRTIKKLIQVLTTLLANDGFHVHSQQPVILSEINVPEPDVAIVRGEIDDYNNRHPGPAETALIIEVADSSRIYDQTTKQRLYAVAGIPQYWIVDLKTNQIEVYAQPDPQQERYGTVVRYGAGEVVPFTLGSQELELSVGDIL